MSSAILWTLLGLVVLVAIIAVLARFYVRGTRETSLVKTGVGGRRVVMDGGVIAVPEPSTIALAAVAATIGGVGAVSKRRKKARLAAKRLSINA